MTGKIMRHGKTPTARRIDEVFAWLAEDADGSEGVCGMNFDGGWVAMVGADMDRIKSLRPHAEHIRRQTGMPVRLVRFSRRDDLEELP